MSMPVISHTLRSECSKTFRDPSFSSYLDVTEENFVLQLGSATAKTLGKNSLNSSISTTEKHLLPGSKKLEDLEIDVFNAERYFNGGLNSTPRVSNKNLQKKDNSSGVLDTKEPPPIGSPSIRSESSRNSRSALLHIGPRNQHQHGRTNKKSFLTGGCCNFSCTEKNSVAIDDHHQNVETCSSKSTSTRITNGGSRQGDQISADQMVRNKFVEPVLRVNSDGHFSFPVFTPKTGNQTGKIQVEVQQKPVEVFGSPILEKRKNCWNLEKEFTWDEAKIFSIANQKQSDGESNASSSDLFEIESLSNGNPFLSRQTSRTGYAPSEASIEWSVITASAADFSVLSDSEELRSGTTNTTPKMGVKSRNGPKLRSGILSGCKSQKAVRVAGDAHRVSNEKGFSNAKKPLTSESSTLGTRSHEESKRMDFDVRNRQKSFDSRVLPQTRPGSAAHLLYT